jgi:secernin
MCDTVAVVSADGVLFGKNSDRDVNEAQLLEWVPAAVHPAGATVQATHVAIPEVDRTYAVLLCRPWWMFGAEMGANEFGVVIGNEAVYTTEPDGPPALTGMDLVRLALQRATCAADAVEVIVTLLARHGQGGPCSFERPSTRYHNSFLVVDRREAYVLETAGSHSATELVPSGVRSISNGLTIAPFAARFARPVKDQLVQCGRRRALTERRGVSASGPRDLFALLRDHGGDEPHWSPLYGSLGAPCVHGGGLVTSSQTTGSLVADLRSDVTLWATGTAAPCTGLFKPVSIHDPVDVGDRATNRFDDRSLWWRHERFHRRVIADFAATAPSFVPARDELEREWTADPPDPKAAFAEAERLTDQWERQLPARVIDHRPAFVRRQWDQWDAAAGL